MQNKASRPIGIFDSGLGGLTVVRAVMERLPMESVVYFGDTARVPYGVKSPAVVSRYAGEIVRFLLGRDVKLLIVACNTMAAVALDAIKALSPVPVLEVIDAGARAALAAARDMPARPARSAEGAGRARRIGVIATPSTIKSEAYVRAIHARDPEAAVFTRACPLFVPLVEEGWLTHPVTRLTAVEYLTPLLAENLDTLILGCTHYPLLKPLLQDVVGPDVRLVDSAEAVSKRAEEALREMGLENAGDAAPRHSFHVTDGLNRFQEIGEGFLGRTLDEVRLETL